MASFNCKTSWLSILPLLNSSNSTLWCDKLSYSPLATTSSSFFPWTTTSNLAYDICFCRSVCANSLASFSSLSNSFFSRTSFCSNSSNFSLTFSSSLFWRMDDCWRLTVPPVSEPPTLTIFPSKVTTLYRAYVAFDIS